MRYSCLYRDLLVGVLLLGSAVALPICEDEEAPAVSASTSLASSPTSSNSLPTAIASSAKISTSTALRILALGDSITYGFNENPSNSYRKFLQCSLSTSGVPATYIGTTTSGDWTNNAVDGYVGQTIEQIGSSASWILGQSPPPNLVLLHAGSNDILHSVNVDTAPQRLGTLLDTVIAKTGASVLVAQIIKLGEGYEQYNDLVNTYNAAIPAVVATRVAAGKNVKVVDMSGRVDAGELIDGIHPVAEGYRKMAAAWLAGLDGLKVSNVTGAFVDLGASAVPSSGNCADLKA
ncbi:SGNH hydrolase-type esterase domain-containing protein [Cadophora sp. MPI-SDFR-AT-0126]|nr:SGNH hydrolase-type esterase domain-containing protein [Leotiomycetes sp. MPI-SDFR-AT-0126]